MSALLSASPLLPPQNYLAGEVLGEERHEFIGGEVYSMAGASAAHDTISLKWAASLLCPVRRGHGILGCQTWKTRILLRSTRTPYDPTPSCRECCAGCQGRRHLHGNRLSAGTYSRQ